MFGLKRIATPATPPAGPTRPASESPSDREQAHDLVLLCQRAPEQHQIMAENMASYLAHLRSLGVNLPVQKMTDQKSVHKAINEALSEAGDRSNNESQLHLAAKLRWLSKLQRDVKAPYTDRDVAGRVETCCADLKKLLPSFSEIPHRLFLVGGPLASQEGRFGANSDLDLVMAVDPKDRERANAIAAQLTSQPANRKDTVQIYVTSDPQLPEVLEYFGGKVLLAEANLVPEVRQTVQDGLRSHGLHLGQNPRGERMNPPELHPMLELKKFPSQQTTALKF